MVNPFSILLPAALIAASPIGLAAVADNGNGTPILQESAGAAAEPAWVSFSEADQTYNDIIIRGVAIEDRVADLKGDISGSRIDQLQRLYLASMLQWRHGQREAALASVGEALRMGRHGELLRHQGRLLEASGKIPEAVESYREAIPLLFGDARSNAELRLAILLAGDDIEPLLSLAERSGPAFRNRIAMVLAVLGHPGAAAGLYTLAPDASGERQMRHYLRLTEWALLDRDVLKAQDTAWRAVRLATTRADRLYLLALLTEAHRKDASLPELINKLEAAEDLGDSARALWVSLLRETGRIDEALTLLKDRAEQETPAVKRQLVGLYRESGQTAAMLAELERLMTVDADETIWPESLAGLHLERGDADAAREVWRGFIEQSQLPSALLAGAGVMKRLGFDELALTAAKKAQRDATVLNLAARFRFELHMDRGRRGEAREVLRELEASLDAADPFRKTVAMWYERLQLPAEALRVIAGLVDAAAGQHVDARLYLARLQIAAGAAEQAVVTLMPAMSAAVESQRRLIQTRVIAAAAAAGTAEQLESLLRDKLADGSAAESEIQLLIEMNIRRGEGDAALALIDAAYGKPGGNEVEQLKQTAALHRALGNWQAYDEVLAQLAEQDPANAVFHIRGRIINYIDNLRALAETDREVYVTLMALMEAYREVAGSGADREFQAGVLSMAGQGRRALSIYREVLAVDPSRLDNYLAIGNQLAAMRQTNQAIGMYQYLVESTEREEVSWAALDGILNLEPDRETLRWAQRMALERLAAVPDKFDYYRQLADLSADLGDGRLRLSALHNGLAAEPELRMSTLRELLRITSTVPQSAAPGQTAPRSERHITFGRRLLALGLAMPPDVYLSLGKAMVDAGDNEAALEAVTRAVENTGNDELLVRAAYIFQQARDELSADRLLEKALVNDPTNLDLILQLARSSERLEDNTRAGELYLRGLKELLNSRQPRVETPAVKTGIATVTSARQLDRVLLDEGREAFPLFRGGRTHSRDYQQYYIPLRNGLVRSLIGDRQRQAAVLDGLQAGFDATLAQANVEPLPLLANYPRLDREAQLLRYLAYNFGDYAAVNGLDRKLLQRFTEDALLPEILVSHRTEWGGTGYLNWLERSTSLTAEQNRQLQRHWHAYDISADGSLPAVRETALRLVAWDPTAVLPEPALQALQDELRNAIRSGVSAEVLGAGRKLIDAGSVWDTLQTLESHLSAEDKQSIARYVTSMLEDDIDLAANSLRIARYSEAYDLKTWPSPWAARLSEWSGDRVLDEQRLLEIVTAPADAQPGNPRLGRFDLWFVYRSLSMANQDKWFEHLLAADSQAASWQAVALTALSLQRRQDQASAERLKRVMRDHQQLATFDLWLTKIDIHPDNTGLARELADIIGQRYFKAFPDPIFEPNLLRCEGKTDAALNALVELFFNAQLPSMSGGGGGRDAMQLVGLYQSRLVAGNETKLIEILNDTALSSSERIAERDRWLLQLYRSIYAPDSKPLLDFVLAAMESEPDNAELVTLAAGIHDSRGERFSAHRVLQEQHAHLPDDQRVRRVNELIQSARRLDHPVNVLKYQTALGQASTLAGNTASDTIYEALTGADHTRLKREMIRFWQSVRASEHTVLMRNNAGDLHEIDLPGINRFLNVTDIERLKEVLAGEREAERLLPLLVEHPLGVEVLEAWFGNIRGRMLGQAQELIDALADAHVLQGSAAQRFTELTDRLREQRAGDRELSLWLAIGTRVPALAAGDDAGALLRSYIASETAFRPPLLIGMTTFLAARGDHDDALVYFRTLIAWAQQRITLLRVNDRNHFALGTVLAKARNTLAAEAYRKLLRGVLDTVEPWQEHLLSSYSEFVVDQFDQAEDREAFYRAFEADLDAALENLTSGQLPVGIGEASSARLFGAAAAQFQLGRQSLALNTFRRAMAAKADEAQSSMNPTRARVFHSLEKQTQDIENGNYRSLLGLDPIWISSNPGIPGSMFPADDLPWLKQADARIRGWVDADEFDRNLVVELLLELANAYEQAGAERELNELFEYLGTQLGYRDEINLHTAAAVVTSAGELGLDLNNARLEKELLLEGAIEPQHMAVALQRIADAEGNSAALETGAALLEFTLEDGLMDVLIGLAEKAGQTERVREWRALQKRAQVSRKELQQSAVANSGF